MTLKLIGSGIAIIFIIRRRSRSTFGARKRQRRRRKKHQTCRRLCIRRCFVEQAGRTTIDFIRSWRRIRRCTHLTPLHFLTQTLSNILTPSRVSANKRTKCCCQSWLKSWVCSDHFRCCRYSISLRKCRVVVVIVVLHVGLVKVLHLLSPEVHTTKDVVPVVIIIKLLNSAIIVEEH